MNLELKIVKNEEALELLENNIFISKWKELASQQANVTVQQEFPFVSTWYKQYFTKFSPILILGYDPKAQLVGLIPLAQSLDNSQISHAGHLQAEYCGWICKESYCELFITQAIVSIKNHFNLKRWTWGWVTPNSDISWFFSDTLKKANIYIKYREFDSPLLDVFDNVKINELKKNRSLKTKTNRYIKGGKFYIERITSKDKAIEIFDVLEKQSDFRQMAINKVSPFGDDPNKGSYYINKLDFPNDCHFTVLWSNNRPIAYNFGECDSTTVYLGVTSYDPTESKNSPGKIHLVMLAEFIKKEGFRYLDLTPGNDGYKEWFCNTRQKLYYLNIFFDKKNYLISKLRDAIIKPLKNTAKKLNVEPKIIISNFKTVPSKIKETFKKPFKKEIYIYYRLNIKKIEKYNTNVKQNNYSDLLFCNKNDDKKQHILSQALRRFSLNDKLFSVIKNNKKVHYGWMTTKLKNQNIPQFDNQFEFPANSAILYDFFVEDDNLLLIIQEMINECKIKNIDEVYIGAHHFNSSFIKIIYELGFKPYQKLTITSILGNTKRSMSFIE